MMTSAAGPTGRLWFPAAERDKLARLHRQCQCGATVRPIGGQTYECRGLVGGRRTRNRQGMIYDRHDDTTCGVPVS